MSGKWDAVAPAYILESVLLVLCEEMTKLIDDPDLANVMGEAMLKLSDALADYRGSRGEGSLSHRATPGVRPCVILVGPVGGHPSKKRLTANDRQSPSPSARVATATRIDIDPPFKRTVTSGDPSAPGSRPKVPCTPGVLGALYGLPTASPLTGLDAPATRG